MELKDIIKLPLSYEEGYIEISNSLSDSYYGVTYDFRKTTGLQLTYVNEFEVEDIHHDPIRILYNETIINFGSNGSVIIKPYQQLKVIKVNNIYISFDDYIIITSNHPFQIINMDIYTQNILGLSTLISYIENGIYIIKGTHKVQYVNKSFMLTCHEIDSQKKFSIFQKVIARIDTNPKDTYKYPKNTFDIIEKLYSFTFNLTDGDKFYPELLKTLNLRLLIKIGYRVNLIK